MKLLTIIIGYLIHAGVSHEKQGRTNAKHTRKSKERRDGGAAIVANASAEGARFEVRGAAEA